MKLEEYLRNQYSNYIRPLYIKLYCESCGANDNLELHHIKQFSEILKETLEELNISYYDDIKAYTDNQIELINYVMLGKQLKCNYLTLCTKCHDDEHNGNLKFSFSNYNLIHNKQYYDNLKINIQLDNKYIGVKLTPEIRNDMIFLYLSDIPERYRSWQQLKRLLEYNGHNVIVDRNGTFIDYKPSIKQYKEKKEKESIRNISISYLNSIIDKKLFKDEQQKLIEILNIKDKRGRLLKSYNSINIWFKDNNFNYKIKSNRVKKDNSLYTIWIVNKS